MQKATSTRYQMDIIAGNHSLLALNYHICLVQLFEPFAQKDNCQQLFSPDEFLPFEEYGPLCEETNPESWTTSLELQFQNARCCPLEL
ncbi:uncharacterized protein FFB20_00160 [Fusarium fujikuroi]|nr:uncharacterized protein FFB20_00160 [Fusarium fujikuroi]